MFIGPVISFPLMAARENRESRVKYLKGARSWKHDDAFRKIDLDLAKMFKAHEKAWMVTYNQEIANA